MDNFFKVLLINAKRDHFGVPKTSQQRKFLPTNI